MSDTSQETTTKKQTLRALETPPRTTGNMQQDFPILIDWFYKAYQVIQAAVKFINDQVTSNPNITIADLPDPATSTVAQAQQTANEAYLLANTAQNRLNGFLAGTFTITDAADSETLNFSTDQVDANYRIMIQAINTTGTPDDSSYVVKSKTYGTGSFSVTLVAAPGIGNSVTFEWQLIRNS